MSFQMDHKSVIADIFFNAFAYAFLYKIRGIRFANRLVSILCI